MELSSSCRPAVRGDESLRTEAGSPAQKIPDHIDEGREIRPPADLYHRHLRRQLTVRGQVVGRRCRRAGEVQVEDPEVLVVQGPARQSILGLEPANLEARAVERP